MVSQAPTRGAPHSSPEELEWQERCRLEFLSGYGLDNQEESSVALRTLILEKALYEIIYEIENRPSWLQVPLRGILRVLREPSDSEMPA